MAHQNGDPGPGKTVTVCVELTVAGRRLGGSFPVSAGPASRGSLLPTFRSLADKMVQIAIEDATARGEQISCRAGCGACCRQLVPISEIEARRLRDLIDGMPVGRRAEIRERFVVARQRLGEGGLLEKLEHPERFPDQAFRSLAAEYLEQGIACPFLEAESCSIHPDRPIACREYLVSSPPEYCARPMDAPIQPVEVPLKVAAAVQRLDADPPRRFTRWVALALTLERAEQEREEDLPPRTGPELMEEFLKRLG
jgi:Fe-S-cluster containining protein